MRVLHICSGNLYGGVERLLVTIARYSQVHSGVEPHFSICFEGRLSSELRDAGSPVQNVGAARLRNPMSVRTVRSNLQKLLFEYQFDAAVCHSAWSQAIFGPVVKWAGVPLLFWLHGAPSGHWLERVAARIRPTKVICNSEFTSRSAWKLYPGIAKEVLYPACTITTHPYDPELRLQVRSEWNTPADSMVIVQVSRLERWKGHLQLLVALGELKTLADWTCWIVGGPQRPAEKRYFQELKKAADEYGIRDRVQFLGQSQNVGRLLRAAEIFCQPNTGPEPFGLVFIEALADGLPVVTSAIGGGAEIVDESCGILTPPEESAALATALQKLITDSELRMRLSAAGPARARQFCDPKQQLRRLASVIEETVTAESSVTA
jgi:glycosyltransferase involved in cell wall biosynthesis